MFARAREEARNGGKSNAIIFINIPLSMLSFFTGISEAHASLIPVFNSNKTAGLSLKQPAPSLRGL